MLLNVYQGYKIPGVGLGLGFTQDTGIGYSKDLDQYAICNQKNTGEPIMKDLFSSCFRSLDLSSLYAMNLDFMFLL